MVRPRAADAGLRTIEGPVVHTPQGSLQKRT